MQYDRERFLLPRNWKQGKRHRVLLLDIRNSGKTSLRRLHLGRLEQALKILESVAMREQIGPRPWGRTVCGCWKLTRKLAWLERAEQAGDCGGMGRERGQSPDPDWQSRPLRDSDLPPSEMGRAEGFEERSDLARLS